MRTTLTIDDDVLQAAKERAAAEGRTSGEVISELARQALNQSPVTGAGGSDHHGFRPLASRGGVVTVELVADLADDE